MDKQNKVEQIYSSRISNNIIIIGSLVVTSLDWEPKVDVSIRDGSENFLIQSKFSWFKLPDSGGKRYQFSTGFLGG